MPNSAMLSQSARDAAGIPQDLPSYAGPGVGAEGQPSTLDLMSALKGGQLSAAKLLQLLAMLLNSGQMPQGGGMPGGGQEAGGSSPIEAAYLGGQ